MGSVFKKITNVLTGGISGMIQGDDPLESIMSAQQDLATSGLYDSLDESWQKVIGVAVMGGLDPVAAMYTGLKDVQEELSAPNKVEPKISSDVTDLGNTTRALLARQYSPEEQESLKKKKKKTTKKTQFKVDLASTTGLVTDTDKVVGIQL